MNTDLPENAPDGGDNDNDSSSRPSSAFSSLRRQFFHRRRVCPLAEYDDESISYKNPDLLKKYISERGRILPSRITSVSHQKQVKLAHSIKLARFLGMLPYKPN